MTASESTFVGALQAETHLPELLDRVEAGEQITITRDGAPVARLVPIQPALSVEIRREAIREMRKLAARNRLRDFTLKDLISEGRK